MKVRWNNIAVLILAVTVVVLMIRGCTPLTAALSDASHIGPGHSWEEKTVGLIVLGFMGLFLVAIVKILTHNREE